MCVHLVLADVGACAAQQRLHRVHHEATFVRLTACVPWCVLRGIRVIGAMCTWVIRVMGIIKGSWGCEGH